MRKRWAKIGVAVMVVALLGVAIWFGSQHPTDAEAGPIPAAESASVSDRSDRSQLDVQPVTPEAMVRVQAGHGDLAFIRVIDEHGAPLDRVALEAVPIARIGRTAEIESIGFEPYGTEIAVAVDRLVDLGKRGLALRAVRETAGSDLVPPEQVLACSTRVEPFLITIPSATTQAFIVRDTQDGRPLADAMVYLSLTDLPPVSARDSRPNGEFAAGYAGLHRGVTDARGELTMTGLRSGRHAVRVIPPWPYAVTNGTERHIETRAQPYEIGCSRPHVCAVSFGEYEVLSVNSAPRGLVSRDPGHGSLAAIAAELRRKWPNTLVVVGFQRRNQSANVRFRVLLGSVGWVDHTATATLLTEEFTPELWDATSVTGRLSLGTLRVLSPPDVPDGSLPSMVLRKHGVRSPDRDLRAMLVAVPPDTPVSLPADDYELIYDLFEREWNVGVPLSVRADGLTEIRMPPPAAIPLRVRLQNHEGLPIHRTSVVALLGTAGGTEQVRKLVHHSTSGPIDWLWVPHATKSLEFEARGYATTLVDFVSTESEAGLDVRLMPGPR